MLLMHFYYEFIYFNFLNLKLTLTYKFYIFLISWSINCIGELLFKSSCYFVNCIVGIPNILLQIKALNNIY